MSTLSVATIKNTGSGQMVFRDSSDNIVGQLVQVWVNFAGGKSGLTAFGIRASTGVSSVVDNGEGDYTINFSTAFFFISDTLTYADMPVIFNLLAISLADHLGPSNP